MAGLSMIGLLAHFIRLATATCSQCGDINPYLDSDDPKFLCRQCRTRAQAWGGDKKKDPNQPTKEQIHQALKTFADILNDKVEEYLAGRRYINRGREPLKIWQHGSKQGFMPLYRDFTLTRADFPDMIFDEIVNEVLNPMLGQPVNNRIESDGRKVAYWNVGGDIDDENDAHKASRVRLLTQPHDPNIRLIIMIPSAQ